MVPLLFRPYAQVMAQRAAEFGPRRILETAAGTGVVTEALARALPDAEIVATDLNQAMLDVAATRVSSAQCRIPASGCARPAVRRRQLRPRRLPVRRHVLSRQGARATRRRGGCFATAVTIWSRSGTGSSGTASPTLPTRACNELFPGQPADVHEARAVQLPRAGMDRARPGRRRLQRTSRIETVELRAAARRPNDAAQRAVLWLADARRARTRRIWPGRARPDLRSGRARRCASSKAPRASKRRCRRTS